MAGLIHISGFKKFTRVISRVQRVKIILRPDIFLFIDLQEFFFRFSFFFYFPKNNSRRVCKSTNKKILAL